MTYIDRTKHYDSWVERMHAEQQEKAEKQNYPTPSHFIAMNDYLNKKKSK